jgi:hypothetical protein
MAGRSYEKKKLNKGDTICLYHRVDRVLSFFLQLLELGPPPPHQKTSVLCPPLVPGGEGVVGSQFQRGDIHCGSLGTYVLCGINHPHFYLAYFAAQRVNLGGRA